MTDREDMQAAKVIRMESNVQQLHQGLRSPYVGSALPLLPGSAGVKEVLEFKTLILFQQSYTPS